MNKKEIILFLVSLWNREEIELLENSYINKEKKSLYCLIENRYKDYYLTIFEIEKDYWKNLVCKYKKILNKSTSSIVCKLFLNELENKVFVCPSLHKQNQEMIENIGVQRVNKRVSWAIKEIIKCIDPVVLKDLELTIHGVNYSLEEQLKARWSNLLLWTVNLNIFKENLVIGNHLFFNSLSMVKCKTDWQFYLFYLDTTYFKEKPRNILKLPFLYFRYLFKNHPFRKSLTLTFCDPFNLALMIILLMLIVLIIFFAIVRLNP